MIYSLIYIGLYNVDSAGLLFRMYMKGILFIISAPSGAGKTTLLHAALSDLKHQMRLERVITYTTKKPRVGEKDGQHYHFVPRERFDQLLAQGFFMEYSKAYTDYYGSPACVIEGLNQGISYLLIVDRVGAQEIVKKVSDVVLIWIEAPSLAVLKERLTRRGTDSEDQMKRRLSRAQVEMDLEKKLPLYKHHIINDTLTLASSQLKAIISHHIQIKKGSLGGASDWAPKEADMPT